MKSKLARFLAIFLMVSMAGCGSPNRASTQAPASQPRLPEDENIAFHLSANAKIAVAEGQFNLAAVDPPPNSQDTYEHSSSPSSITNSPFAQCVGQTLLIGAPICAVMFGSIYALGSGVAAIRDGIAAPGESSNNELHADNELLKLNESEILKIKATTELLEKLAPSMESIPARIQRLIAPLNDQPEYIFEIAPPHTTFDQKNQFSYGFVVGTQGRLLRVSDRAVMHTFSANETIYVSSYTFANSSTTEVASRLNSKLEPALNELARKFIDRWIIPLFR